MQSAQFNPAQFLSQVSDWDASKIEQFIRELQSLVKRKNETDPEKKANLLIEQLNKTVFSSEKLERFSFLIVKNRKEDLQEEELSELTQLLKQDQNLHIERMKIMFEIAQLKNISVQKLSEDLGIKPPPLV